jgi:hypothetical protein
VRTTDTHQIPLPISLGAQRNRLLPVHPSLFPLATLPIVPLIVNDRSAHRYTAGSVANAAATTAIRQIKVARFATTTGEVVAATFTTLVNSIARPLVQAG